LLPSLLAPLLELAELIECIAEMQPGGIIEGILEEESSDSSHCEE
jgi:hypothetical protein